MMAVKLNLPPKEAAALLLAAQAGANASGLSPNARQNAALGIKRLARRMGIHRVDVSFAENDPAYKPWAAQKEAA